MLLHDQYRSTNVGAWALAAGLEERYARVVYTRDVHGRDWEQLEGSDDPYALSPDWHIYERRPYHG